MSGTCRSCRFWTLRPGDRLGTCERWHHGYGINPDEVADNEAWVEDDEGWGNATGPDFGCVLFAPAEIPTTQTDTG